MNILFQNLVTVILNLQLHFRKWIIIYYFSKYLQLKQFLYELTYFKINLIMFMESLAFFFAKIIIRKGDNYNSNSNFGIQSTLGIFWKGEITETLILKMHIGYYTFLLLFEVKVISWVIQTITWYLSIVTIYNFEFINWKLKLFQAIATCSMGQPFCL